MRIHANPCTPMADQKPRNGDYMLKHVRIRKIGKWLVLITAYLYIPLLVTFMLKGNRSGSLDIPVGKSVITGPKVNIVYNNGSQAVSLEDFVTMAVAREYSRDSNGTGDQDEMLKALAVLIRTDVVCQMDGRNVIDSTSLENGYLRKSQMKTLWGKNWQETYNKIAGLVKETSGQVIKYQEKCVRTMYTRVSTGKTMSGSRLLGEEFTYLAEVECPKDLESPDYQVTKEFTGSEILSCIKEKKKETGIDTDNPCQDIQVVSKTDEGYVTGMQVGDLVMSGEEFAQMMGLNSAYLSVEYRKDSIKITSKGVGMGFGMSLYTANIMSLDGENYQKIIKHFYPECIILSL